MTDTELRERVRPDLSQMGGHIFLGYRIDISDPITCPEGFGWDYGWDFDLILRNVAAVAADHESVVVSRRYLVSAPATDDEQARIDSVLASAREK